MIAVYRCRVVARFLHDAGAFAQGLFWSSGRLFESTGLVGASTLREVRLEDGAVLRSVPFPPGTFGGALPHGAVRSSASPGRTGSSAAGTGRHWNCGVLQSGKAKDGALQATASR
jgi:hypothetical protein